MTRSVLAVAPCHAKLSIGERSVVLVPLRG